MTIVYLRSTMSQVYATILINVSVVRGVSSKDQNIRGDNGMQFVHTEADRSLVILNVNKMKELTIVDQRVKFDDTGDCILITELSNGSITVEPITPEEAAQFEAESRF